MLTNSGPVLCPVLNQRQPTISTRMRTGRPRPIRAGRGKDIDGGSVHKISIWLNLAILRSILIRFAMTVENWLIRIFDQAPVAIALLEGPDHRIKLANRTMYDIWQLSDGQKSVIGEPVFEAFPNIAGIGLEELLAEVRRTGQPVQGQQAPYTRPDQQTAYVDFVYAPIYNEVGTLNIVVVATEVTQQVLARQQQQDNEDRYRQLAEALAASNRELAIANQALNSRNQELASINQALEETNSLLSQSNDNLQTFAYVASHDLQEPLRKIQTFSDILQTHYASELGEGARYLERIRTAASRMSLLIKDLLGFSRIATHRSTQVPVALNQVVQDVLVVLDLAIAESGALVEVGDLPTVIGDAIQLEQLFQNLISNALKFGQTGQLPHIRLLAHTLPAEALPGTVKPTRRTSVYYRIDVADNGIGFEEKYLDRIFQVFQRLHGKGNFPGTGIGLAICEKVVANHGGAISASSYPGQGATFSVYLPVE